MSGAVGGTGEHSARDAAAAARLPTAALPERLARGAGGHRWLLAVDDAPPRLVSAFGSVGGRARCSVTAATNAGAAAAAATSPSAVASVEAAAASAVRAASNTSASRASLPALGVAATPTAAAAAASSLTAHMTRRAVVTGRAAADACRRRREPAHLSHPLPREARRKTTSAQRSDGRATAATMVE